MYRRDRLRRRADGVAVYVRSSLPSSEWIYEGDNRLYEVIWVRVTNVFIAAVYHPPKPLYKAERLLDYIESCVDALNHQYPTANIVIAGDTNQLPERDMIERTGLAQIVLQPTRGANILDRVFTSGPLYKVVRVVQSTGKSDHKAVIAYCSRDQAAKSHTKTLTRLKYRRKSPTQNALFLQNSYQLTSDVASRLVKCRLNLTVSTISLPAYLIHFTQKELSQLQAVTHHLLLQILKQNYGARTD